MSTKANWALTERERYDQVEDAFFPLLPIQQSYLYGRSAVPLGGYSTQAYYEVDFETLDPLRVERAFNRLLEYHPSLRLAFTEEGKQYVVPYQYVRVPFYDFLDCGQDEASVKLGEIRAAVEWETRPLDVGALNDVRVSRLPGGHYRLHVSVELLTLDLSSLFNLVLQFGTLYRDVTADLPTIEGSFAGFARAHEAAHGDEQHEAARAYWLGRLESFPSALQLPRHPHPPAPGEQSISRHEMTLDAGQWRAFKRFSKSVKVPPTVLLLTVYAEVLGRWAKSPHFALNVTTMNRWDMQPNVEEIVGDFTGNALVEFDLREEMPLAKRVRKVARQLKNDVRNGRFSGVEFLRELIAARGPGPQLAMDTVFTSYLRFTQPFADRYTWRDSEHLVTAKLGYNRTRTSQVAIDHQACEMLDGSALLWWDAVDEAFPDGLVGEMFEVYERTIRALTSGAATEVAVHDMLPQAQREIRRHVNDEVSPVSSRRLHELFTEQARVRGSHAAVRTTGRDITYEQLDAWSDALAAALVSLGVVREQLVATVMRKGWEQVVAVLAIQKAGGAYMPVDADFPDGRIEALLESSGCRVVLRQDSAELSTAIMGSLEVIDVSAETLEALTQHSARFTPVPGEVTDTAYVIFTSGSTGKPKGVVIDHRGAVNTVLDINRRFEIGTQDVVFGLSSLGFDLSVYDIFGTFAAGATLVLPDYGDVKRQENWLGYLERFSVSVWNSVPALMQLLVDDCETKRRQLPMLKVIMLSGDWIPVGLPGRIFDMTSSTCQLISLGGATEASIWSIFHPITTPTDHLSSVPYGKPLTNQTFFVLDGAMRPCPDWVVGDLYIGGIGVAKGYWDDEVRTAGSFVDSPEGRLYRTGDLGRYIGGGTIEIAGREDNQVKVQGHRIELGEIEATLRTHEQVEEAIVCAVGEERNKKALVAYVVEKRREDAGASHYGDVELRGKAERDEFTLSKPGVRRLAAGQEVIALPLGEAGADTAPDGPIDALATLLHGARATAVAETALAKYAYPSASSLYPVQIYVQVPAPIGHLASGRYYYRPDEHSLYRLDTNATDSAGPAEILLVADMSAIEPLYEKALAEKLVTLEAGYLSQVLSEAADEDALVLTPTWCGNARLASDGDVFPRNAALLARIECSGRAFGNEAPSSESAPSQPANEPTTEEARSATVGDISLPRPSAPTSEAASEVSDFARQSYRRYLSGPVELSNLSAMLAGLEHTREGNLRYFLYLRRAKPEDPVRAECWYEYLPHEHSLRRAGLRATQEVQQLFTSPNDVYFDRAAFMLCMTSDELADDGSAARFAAGAVGQRLMSRCWRSGIGVCPIGELRERPPELGNAGQLLHSFVGGAIEAGQTQRWNPAEDLPRASGSQPLAERTLSDFLSERLPAYMVPRMYMIMSSLPLTPTGKVDRKALPVPSLSVANQDDYVAPVSDLEKLLAQVWSEALERARIGIHENFFALGGNSLLAMKIAATIRQVHGLDVQLRTLFEQPTIAMLADAIVRERQLPAPETAEFELQRLEELRSQYVAKRGTAAPPFPLSPAQEHLYAYEQLAQINSAYNIMISYDVDETLNVAMLRGALRRLLQQHEALTLSFSTQDGELSQVPRPDLIPSLEVMTVGSGPEAQRDARLARSRAKALAQPFDLKSGPVRFVLSRDDDGRGMFAILVHHIVADYMSTEILARDMIRFYEEEETAVPGASRSTPTGPGYLDLVLWQQQFAAHARGRAQIDYWRSTIAGAPRLHLRCEPPNVPESKSGKWHEFEVSDEVARSLRSRSQTTDVTLFTLGLGAFHQVVEAQSGQGDIVIGTPVSTRFSDSLEHTVGMLLNTLAIRLRKSDGATGAQFLSSARSAVLEAMEHRHVPHEVLSKEIADDVPRYGGNLYRVRYVYRVVQPGSDLAADGALRYRHTEMDRSESKFDLLLNLNDDGRRLYGDIEYAAEIFDDHAIRVLAEQWQRALAWFADRATDPLSTLASTLDGAQQEIEREDEQRLRERKRARLSAIKRRRREGFTPRAV